MSYYPDGKRIVTGSFDRLAMIWDAKTGALIREALIGHSEAISSVSFSPDGTRIITGGFDNLAIIWDANTGN